MVVFTFPINGSPERRCRCKTTLACGDRSDNTVARKRTGIDTVDHCPELMVMSHAKAYSVLFNCISCCFLFFSFLLPYGWGIFTDGYCRAGVLIYCAFDPRRMRRSVYLAPVIVEYVKSLYTLSSLLMFFSWDGV